VTAVRALVVIGDDLYVRSFIRTGAFEGLGGSTAFVASSRLANLEDLAALPGYAGTIEDSQERMDVYAWLRAIGMAAARFRSRTMRIKSAQAAPRLRRRLTFYSLPGIRGYLKRRILRRLGPNEQLDELLRQLQPDIVISPTAGTDALTLDAIWSARRAGIPSLVLINGWDTLSSKAVFPIAPDFFGVWGEQSVAHAQRIHRIPRSRVFPLGVPTFEAYFHFKPEQSPSPFEFPYVLFAGSALPFDELTALRTLDDTLELAGSPLKIVYRPHPWRHPRASADQFDEREFTHVLLDEEVRQVYEAGTARHETIEPKEFLPRLDYYPALVGHAQVVISPLSTMVVEGCLLDRAVLALAYDDGVHEMPMSTIFTFDHFAGLEEVGGIEVCHDLQQLGSMLELMLATDYGSIRANVRNYLFFDDRSYAERLAEAVSVISSGTSRTPLRLPKSESR
jgi:hypothetical protein